MRLMDRIRRRGQLGLIIFMGFFVVSIFAGLGISQFNFGRNQAGPREQQDNSRAVQLVSDGPLGDAILLVNGSPVSNEDFFEVLNFSLAQSREQANDPAFQFEAYGQVAQYMIRQRILLDIADEQGLRVSSDELNEEREQAIAQYMSVEDGTSGNVIADLAKKLGSSRERKAAFSEFLTRSGLTEQKWESDTRTALLTRKANEYLQEQADATKEIEANETKALVDEKLADGMEFTEVVKEYSDGPNAESGGDLGTWLKPGLLFDEQAEETVFSTPVGEITPWLEIPAGYQRFEVFDKQEPEGEEFEAEKPKIIEAIKVDKGQDYEPTEQEIADQFKSVKVRQLLIRKTEPGAAQEKLSELVQQAHVQINNPYILAFQALRVDRLNPPEGMGIAELKTLAENSAAGEGYDYSLIQVKLDKGKPQMPGAGDEEEAEAAGVDDATADTEEMSTDGGEAVAEEGADEGADAETDAEDADAPADEVETPAATPEEPEAPVAIYALGIGLLKLAVQEQDSRAGYLPYYMMAKTYLDWLDDEDAYVAQPLDRPVAREEIEENFYMVAERFEYSPLVHAYRGLNLAWLDRGDEARESLELALKYAPRDDQHQAYSIISEAYEVLDDEDKAAEVDELVAQIRQEKLQQQIEQQMAQQEAQGGQAPFDMGGATPVPEPVPDDQVPAAGDDEAPADDGEGAEPAENGEEAEAAEAAEAEPAGDEPGGDEPAGDETTEE